MTTRTDSPKWMQGRIPPFSTSVFLVSVLLGPLGLTTLGCAHKTPEERQVERRIASEPQIKDKAALETRNDRAIDQAMGLSDEERHKLTVLRDSNRARVDALSEESLKIRSLLVQDIVNPDSDPSEITLLKNKLKETENKKVAIYLEGIDEANSLLGRRTHPIEQRERIMRVFMEPRVPKVD